MPLRFRIIIVTLFFTSMGLNAQMVTGTYEGDGTASQSITGLGGDPTVLLIIPESGEEPFLVTGSMPAGNAKLTSADVSVDEEFQTDLITSLDADGFTVQGNANTSSKTYFYVAWDEYDGNVIEGTFTGSTSSQTVDPGFQPEMVWVFANSSTFHENAKLMMSSSPSTTLYFSNGTTSFGGNVFDGVGAGGFDVLASGASGSGVSDGETYYYVAFNSDGNNDFGSESVGAYSGSPDKVTTTVQPEFVFARNNSNLGENSYLKSVNMPGDTSYIPRGTAPSLTTGDLINFESDGFNVGSGGSLRSDFNYYTFPAATLLPVDLIRFNGVLQDDAVHLDWATGSEINSDYFIIERSTDGQHYYPIGRMEATGNSFVEVNYHFIDENPIKGNGYYRLRQVDYDGSFEYHKTVVVNSLTASVMERINIFPNPADNNVRFNITSEENIIYQVQIIDARGRNVKQFIVQTAEGQQTVTVDVSGLSSGNYAVKLIHPDTGYTIGRLMKK